LNNNGYTFKWFVRRDLDGFFGLAIDNLIQLMLITVLCQDVIGLSREFVFTRILPGAALSILLGNLYYAWQARRLAIEEQRLDVTALPYGINTVSLFAHIFLVMLPVKLMTGDPMLAWKVGLLATLGSGIIECVGAFIAEPLRRATPRAALLSTLAGIAITFIAMGFALRIFNQPLVAFLPMLVIFVQYFARIRFPLGLPGGLIAVLLGTALWWIIVGSYASPLVTDWGFYLPHLAVKELLSVTNSEFFALYLSIIIPMGIFNVIGSLQNIESAEAGGDRYQTRPSLLVNGIGTLIGAGLGSCFPTTIYIGHPGWKAMGARAGYSILNGCFVTFLCLTGSMALVLRYVPMEAGVAIVLWIGIVITAQAYQAVPRRHAPAVAVGLFPAIAAYGVITYQNALLAVMPLWSHYTATNPEAGISMTNVWMMLSQLNPSALAIDPQGQEYMRGMIVLERGFIFTSMIWAAISVFLIDREFLKAAITACIASILAFIGLIHAYEITTNGIVTPFSLGAGSSWALAYLFCAFFLFSFDIYLRKWPQVNGQEKRD
jgi:AGZA family xanthine/uracil permease-like MFS transporter